MHANLRKWMSRSAQAVRWAAVRLWYRDVVVAQGRVRIERGLVIRELPGRDGQRLRVTFAGGNSIGCYSVIQGSGLLAIGHRSFIGDGCVIGCNERVTIGSDVMIAQAVSIRDTDHAFARCDRPMNLQGIATSPVTIGDDVWIGHGAVILRGVSIGRGAIVAAGAVVNRDVAPWAVVGGIPARFLRTRAVACVVEGME